MPALTKAFPIIIGYYRAGIYTSFLWDNWDIFAWKPSDMPGVPREEAEHSLDLDMKVRHIKQ